MPRHGRRHRLILYTYTVNRWWKLILGIGLVLLVVAVEFETLPIHLPNGLYLRAPKGLVWTTTGAGVYALVLFAIMFLTRKSAYIQPFENHLRLSTPFLRMNISYRRFLKSSSVEMQHLFPISNYHGSRRKLVGQLATQTAIVLQLRGWPLPRLILILFLSPFFFPDKTSRLALLVPDWMDCSVDMESFRGAWIRSITKTGTSAESALLASIAKSNR